MKRIFSIIMEWGLGLPTGTIAFWGTLVPRILTVDHTFKSRIGLDMFVLLEANATTNLLKKHPCHTCFFLLYLTTY